MDIEMELPGSSLGAEGIGQLVQRPRSCIFAVQALASSVCPSLLGDELLVEFHSSSGLEEPRRCVGSNPTPSEMRIPPELLPESFTFKVATTHSELWRRFVIACEQEYANGQRP